ncbi:RrF2 family transcriptional regulator [Cupriavidus pampae]|uniref:HTH-type transcriptional repressor NsrR n=1 Tax=Cupriavidus pampae TaxID=659251 RepID=A0ABM8XW02_9BURK|nr:Rrf2 family transcriptional regulator [Cupriavidus pampae]CAG9184533.1 HTH-type transcriptional repressor NsrR [Cupriavidus pampae]
MRLTIQTEFGIHALVYLARRKGVLLTAREVAAGIGLPCNHTVKILQRLRQAGYLSTARGRIGGTWLARPAQEISVGEVVRALERPFAVVDCMREDGRCAAGADCKDAIARALAAYLAVLDGISIAEIAHTDP